MTTETPLVLSDLSAATVSSLLALFLPLVVALLTKYDVAPTVRIWVNMFLSAAAGAVGTLVASDGGFAWLTFILSSVAAFLTSALTYMAVWKPTGAAQSVAAKTENVGVGTTRSPAATPDSVAADTDNFQADPNVVSQVTGDGDTQDG